MIPGFVAHQAQRHESQVSLAGHRIARATTIMELVREVNNRPRASSMLRCMPGVKAADSRVMNLAERQADSLVAKRLRALECLAGSEEFCQEALRLRHELRYLLPAVGRVARAAERSLLLMEQSQGDRPIERERARG